MAETGEIHRSLGTLAATQSTAFHTWKSAYTRQARYAAAQPALNQGAGVSRVEIPRLGPMLRPTCIDKNNIRKTQRLGSNAHAHA